MAKTENEPTVSVIIPTYNRARFIGEVIQSVLNQTYQDFELIIADDRSTDNTDEVVESFDNERVRYIRLKEHSGASSAPRNTGLEAARGKYIALLDSDDLWLPNKLKSEVEFLDKHPSVGMVYSGYTYFGSRRPAGRRDFKDFTLVSGHILKELFIDTPPIISSAVLVRKSCFEKVGLFDESLVQCGDIDMWLRIAACFEIDYIDAPLARCRLHDGNRYLQREENIRGGIAMRRKCLESNKLLLNKSDLRIMREYHCQTCRSAGYWYLSNGVRQRGRQLLWEYLRLHPFDRVACTSWLKTFLPPRLSSGMLILWQKVIPHLIRMRQNIAKRLFHT